MTDHQRRVVITGVGVLSPLGDKPESFYDALCEGKSALRPVDLFKLEAMPDLQGGQMAFKATDYLEGRNVRPLDRTGQLVAAASQLALENSGWTPEMRQQQEVGLVLGTMFGSVHTIASFDRRILEAGPRYVKPLDFANSVINAATGQAAIWHDLRGINTTVAGGTSAGLQALVYAADMIRFGRCDALLAGGADELCFESFYGFYKTGRLYGSSNGASGCAVPYDARRNGFALSEGAAFLMLEDAETALARGATILAEVHGGGNSFDPSRGADREKAIAAMERSIRAALKDSALDPQAIDAISASANGSVQGDLDEATATGRVFGDAAASVPVTAVKAMLGEGLGASGAFQTIALLQAMRQGKLPGILGLEQTEDGFPLAMVSKETREINIKRALISALGLDGNSSALVIESRSTADFGEA